MVPWYIKGYLENLSWGVILSTQTWWSSHYLLLYNFSCPSLTHILLLFSVRTNLSDLKLAIEGTIVMSDTLRGLLDAMYDARVPEIWEKMSWQSTTLGFWYTELLERDSQFRRWCFMGRPKVNSTLSYSS